MVAVVVVLLEVVAEFNDKSCHRDFAQPSRERGAEVAEIVVPRSRGPFERGRSNKGSSEKCSGPKFPSLFSKSKPFVIPDLRQHEHPTLLWQLSFQVSYRLNSALKFGKP